ncbi:thiamine phosphate synthase [Sphingoaurantiacus capsulatus]|uniref:Thiamine-phosphate synthase n=1 Tax=Sphingoaurantiacus capsulatus TaxID=1771310 RepID=A0ABV7XCN0_9SPHN
MDEDDFDPEFGSRFERERRPACQLYLISPPRFDPGFPEKLKAALDGGEVAAFQLRLKDVEDFEVIRAGEVLKPILAAYDVALIVNDRADLAAQLGADGVHLGQGDGSVEAARKLLGKEAQIGVTCHDSRHLAMDAAEAGANYVAFGAFFPTTTKETTHRPDPSILGWWTTLSPLPCVAIGGITAANAAPLVAAGADFLAVSNAVWGHAQGPGGAVAEFGKLLSV